MGRILTGSGGGGGISSSDVTAKSADVLAGTKTIMADSNDEVVDGTMVDNGAISASLNCGESYTIPEGHHNGNGKISANSLASQTQGTASASDLLSGKTAIVNGEKLTGSIPDNSSTTSNGNVPGISTSYPNVPTREGDNLQFQTDTSGTARINIGVPRGFYPDSSSSYINRPASDFGNAATAQVLSGTTFTSTAGIKVAGTMADKGTNQYGSWGEGGDYYAINCLPEGYYHSDGYSWAPEARCLKTTVRNSLGITGNKIIPGNTIAGVSSTVSSQGGQTITPTASQQTVWCSGKYMTGNIVINAANIAKKANGSSTISSGKKSFYNSTLSKTESHSYFTVNFSGFNTIMLFAWINGYCAGISYGDTNFNFVTKYTGGGYYTGGATLTNTTAIFPVDTGYGDTTVWWSVAGY